MKNIELELTLEDANLILEGLGQLPFARVYTLIANIQEQARKQLNGQGTQHDEAEVAQPPSIAQESPDRVWKSPRRYRTLLHLE